MKEIVAASAPLLKEHGFKKRRHSFNRRTAAGLVHVVNFWQHPKEPPAWTEVPGLRERRYGTFRLDFGVFVPEMQRSGSPRSEWINEYNCHLRRTIGQLLGEPGDLWWPLGDAAIEDTARAALERHGLPWLTAFSDHAAVLEAYRLVGPLTMGMTPAGGLDIADMLSALGRPGAARQVLEDYVSRSVEPGHADYLATYLEQTGHPDLVDHIRSQPYANPLVE